MKRFVFCIVVVALVLASNPANSETIVGVKGGYFI